MYLEQYEKNMKLSQQDITKIQSKKIKQMIKHCYDNVPYYRKLFINNSIDYKTIDSIEKLKLLPVLTKDIVRDNYDDFLAKNIKKRNVTISRTSGTTGAGFSFVKSKDFINEQWAVWWRFRNTHGIELNTWSAHFSSNPVVPSKQDKPPYWRINLPGRQVLFSAFHMREDTLHAYVNEIIDRKLAWIHGYPSVITILANYIISHQVELKGLIKYVTTGGESLLDYQKKIIESAFKVKVFEHYGLAEGVANISQNKYGDLKVDEDFCAVEFVPHNNTFKIVGTNLSNFAMPLLRYDTQDIATIHMDNNGQICIDSIDGRIEDYLYLSDGRKFGRVSRAFMHTKGIIIAQIKQKIDYSIDINIKKNDSYSIDDEKVILDFFKNTIKFTDTIRINYVEDIEKSKSGKHRLVISEIDQEKGDERNENTTSMFS
jgi:phenylacetate-CoA ligase